MLRAFLTGAAARQATAIAGDGFSQLLKASASTQHGLGWFDQEHVRNLHLATRDTLWPTPPAVQSCFGGSLRFGTSGWNIYVKEHSVPVKEELGGVAQTEVLKELGKRWKSMSQTEKDAYNAKVEKPTPVVVGKVTSKGVGGARKLTGYQLFVKEAYPLYHEKQPNLSTQEIMKLVGAGWKALSDSQRNTYNTAAGKRNVGNGF